MTRICPNPDAWDAAYRKLLRFSSANTCTPSSPPKPLILAGWAYSNDSEKLQRWEETIEWARRNGCFSLVNSIPDAEFYSVATPSTCSVGPMGGPLYLPWDSNAKLRPAADALAKHLVNLQARWKEVVSPEMAEITRPLAFAGAKARCLMVEVVGPGIPPWGEWHQRSSSEDKRRTFTTFRAAINRVLSPHHVDHIRFLNH